MATAVLLALPPTVRELELELNVSDNPASMLPAVFERLFELESLSFCGVGEQGETEPPKELRHYNRWCYAPTKLLNLNLDWRNLSAGEFDYELPGNIAFTLCEATSLHSLSIRSQWSEHVPELCRAPPALTSLR